MTGRVSPEPGSNGKFEATCFWRRVQKSRLPLPCVVMEN